MRFELTQAIAPFDGIVTNEPVREGETVVEGIQNAEGSTFMTIADMSVVTAEVKVDETDIVNIQIGQPAEVTVDAIPNKVFKGHVTLVGDQALLRSTGVATSQSTTGTEEAKDFKVVVTLDTPSDELRPGPLHDRQRSPPRTKSNVLSLPIQALTMFTPAQPRPTAATCEAASSFVQRKDSARCRVFSWSTRMRTASSAPSSFPSPRASPAPPISRFSADSRKATRSSPVPTRHCATLKNGALLKRDTAAGTHRNDLPTTASGSPRRVKRKPVPQHVQASKSSAKG